MIKDVYTWSAIYSDGTSLDEKDAQNFAEVDQSRVKSLILFSFEGPICIVAIPEGAESVFFRRRTIELSPGVDHTTTHCIGWKNGESAVYLFVFNDGSTLLTTDLQAV